jgi:azurin
MPYTQPMRLRPNARLTLVLAAMAVLVVSTAARAQKPAAERTINLTVSDPVDGKMSYSLSRITAKPGERLRVVFSSVGSIPKLVMAHNWLLLRLGVDPKGFVEDAATARDTDFIPPKRKAQVIASSMLIGPGERDQIVFTVPKVAGKYAYICSFPGHFAAGMVGELLVK